nr:copia protein [Tanacetum cinerariifolium]
MTFDESNPSPKTSPLKDDDLVKEAIKELIPQPKNMKIIGTKWVCRNKLDEKGIISRNKARLVAQGYNQQEGIDYDEIYALVARWDLSSLSIFQDPEGTYHTKLATPKEIHRFLSFKSHDPNRTIKSKNVVLSPNQVLTKEVNQDMKRWEELIRENVFGLRGNQDHLPAYLAHMLYCIKQYNPAFFVAKRIKNAWATVKAKLPYGMLLRRLFCQIMELFPHLDNGIYNVVDRVMRPLSLVQARKTQKDRKTQRVRHSTSSSSAYHCGSSSHQVDDDEKIQNEGTFQASTPSPTSYLNSLLPLTHHEYNIPNTSKQNEDILFERQTILLNRQQQRHEEQRDDSKTPSPQQQPKSLNGPNAPSKKPLTKGTSSSPNNSKLNSSPFYSTSPSTNAYLSSPNSPPYRVAYPQPSQDQQPMNITTTLLPKTPLDFAFNTSSPPHMPP